MDSIGWVRWELELLGGWQLSSDGRAVEMGSRQQRVIAAIAVLGAKPRPALAGLLWPESPESKASGNLRAALHIISRNCPQLLCLQYGNVGLEPHVTVDHAELMAHLQAMADADGEVSAHGVDMVQSAELLPGWYEDWVLFERERLRQRQQRTLASLAGLCLQEGDADRALKAANAAAAIEPLCEISEGLVISALLHSGNQALALRSYHAFRDLLWTEMGILPSAHLRGLFPESLTL